MHDAVAAPPGGGVAAGTPALIVEIDFANDPTVTTRTWTDVTSDVREITYVLAGRQHELQRTEAGTLTMVLNNRHGNYDPTNTTGAYYPNVKRTRWIRVRSVWNSVVYPEWQGLIEGYSGEWPAVGKDATVTVHAADGFKPLNLLDLNGYSYPQQSTGARVAAVGADAKVQIGSVDVGVATLPAITFTNATTALSHLQAIEDTEAGLIFMAADGSLTFHDRHHRPLNNSTPVAIIGDNATEIPYSGRTYSELEDSNIWNDIVVTPAQEAGNPDQPTPSQVQNAASIAAHYRRTLSKTLLSESPLEALSAAQFYASLYAEPSLRIPICELVGRADSTQWPFILGAGNSDRFTWKRRPSTEAGTRTITLPVYVERKSTSITVGTDWRVQLQFSPASDVLFWRIGITGSSELGLTTALQY